MATITDLGFETSDGAGGAASWTLTATATYQEWAAYSDASAVGIGVEGFEGGWASDEDAIFAFGGGDITAALYSAPLFQTPLVAEAFEAGWLFNQHFETLSSQFLDAEYGAHAIDGFEDGWGNDEFEEAFQEPDLDEAVY